MFKKSPILLLSLAVFSILTACAGPNHAIKMEEKEEKTSFMPYYYSGVGIGSAISMDSPGENMGDPEVPFTWIHGWYFTATTSLSGSLAMNLPDGNGELRIGLIQDILPLAFSPFVGADMGFRSMGEEDLMLAPGASLKLGANILRHETLQIRIQGNYDFWFAKNPFQSAGVQMALLYRFGRPGIRTLDIE
jgi:hypothetical protein